MTLDNFYRFFVRIIRMNCFRFSCSTYGYRIILSTIYIALLLLLQERILRRLEGMRDPIPHFPEGVGTSVHRLDP